MLLRLGRVSGCKAARQCQGEPSVCQFKLYFGGTKDEAAAVVFQSNLDQGPAATNSTVCAWVVSQHMQCTTRSMPGCYALMTRRVLSGHPTWCTLTCAEGASGLLRCWPEVNAVLAVAAC